MAFFEPSPRQTNLLILLGCAALGYALYLRFSVIESSSVDTTCSAGVVRAVCGLRIAVEQLSEMQFFGGVALIAAIVHFVRPGLAAFTLALVATILGLVLGNAGISGFAAGLLIIAFARPLYANRPLPPSGGRRRTTAPASSRTSH